VNTTIFTVTPLQISALSDNRAAMLVGNILWAEIRRIGLPTTRVNISTRINVPDGGVDASLSPASESC
jgi:uncharacterized protein (UPF0210 family)